MCYGLPYLSSVTDVPSFETKDYFLKNHILGLSSTLLCLRKKGLLAQAPPLDFPVHLHQPGDYVLIKTWKKNKLEPAWEGRLLALLTMETDIQTAERGWTHHTWIKTRKNNGLCALPSRQHQTDFKKTVVKIFFPFTFGKWYAYY
jgi:hypothetical protein